MTEDSVVVKFNHETVEEELKSKVDQLETELETLKDELRLRDEDREQSEMLAQQLDSLKKTERGRHKTYLKMEK